MAPKKDKDLLETGMVADNRRARFDYEVQDTLEAGIVLTGTEVKSLRNGKRLRKNPMRFSTSPRSRPATGDPIRISSCPV